jgi:hypothetical protein
MLRSTSVFLTAALAISTGARPAATAEPAPITFDHFHDHAELTAALKSLASAHPGLMTLVSAGKSHGGRDVWAVVLTNPKTGPAEKKAGFYIDANIHGNEVQGTEVALYAIQYLLLNHGKNELATRLLDERAFYVIPTMNPDSREVFIAQATNPNAPRSGLVPFDDDRDGVADEDGPDDLDGDGSITQMRRRDPNGRMKAHPDDPRILVPVRTGERGEYTLLGTEGIDNDGDGLINEDGPGGYDMNRNFGFNWQPHYVQYGAGDYPFSFPETRVVRDFVLSHPNIAAAQNFHNNGAMILRGPGAKNLGEYLPEDRAVYDFLGQKGEKILPGYRYLTVYKDLYTVYGGSIDFWHNLFGIFTFTNELDPDLPVTPEDEGRPARRESEAVRRARMLQRRLDEMVHQDLVLLGEQYTEWKPFRHPLYGDIEIGGVRKFGRRVPPMFALPETAHRNAAFCFFHADQMARLEFDRVEVKRLDGGVHQIDVRMRNTRVMPTMSAQTIAKKLYRADVLRLATKDARLVAAGELTDADRGLTKALDVRSNGVFVERGVQGFGIRELRLLVRAKGSVTLVYDSLKGGTYEKAVTLP